MDLTKMTPDEIEVLAQKVAARVLARIDEHIPAAIAAQEPNR